MRSDSPNGDRPARVLARARALAGRPWIWYPTTFVAISLLYLFGPLNAGPVYNVLGVSSALAVVYGAGRRRQGGHAGWELIALALALFVAGDALAYNYTPLFGGGLPFPSIADVLYLAVYPSLVVGLFMLVRAGSPSRDRGAVLDALVVTIGIGTLTWVFLMAPYAHDSDLTVLSKAASLAYPTMDLLLLAMCARLVLIGPRRAPSGLMLVVALLTLLATDAAYGWALLHGGYETGGLLDGGWLAFYVLVGTAALHPSTGKLLEAVPDRRVTLTRHRLALLAATSLVAPSVQLVRSFLDLPREPVISVAAGALFLLVLARLAGLVRLQEIEVENRLRWQFEMRLAALVRNASDVVTLVDRQGTVTYVSPSGERLLGRSAGGIVGTPWRNLVHPDDAAAMEAVVGDLPPGASAGFDHRLVGADGAWTEVETLATHLLDDATVGAIVLNTRDVSQRKELERKLAHQATHDQLTALPTRALLESRIAAALARRLRDENRVAVLFIDLDDFKALNDSLGHAAGDSALQAAAARLTACVRASDSAGRVGGDEFVVLLDPVDGPAEAVAAADRCLAALTEPLVIDGHERRLAATIGVALDSPDNTSAGDLVSRADAAMYRAKGSGKGRLGLDVTASTGNALGTTPVAR